MPNHDPDDHEQIDREIHINELKRQAAAAAGGDLHAMESDSAPPEVVEQFWERVVAWETAPQTTHLEQLTKAGMELPAPEAMDDATLSAKLKELIECLAEIRVFLECTDHLSDRELYTRLWSECLRYETPDLPSDECSCWHIDFVSSGSEEDTHAWLKYYADDETRRDWVEQFPDYVLPNHEDPPYDRDRHLPPATHGHRPPLDEETDDEL
jgi:hypothetical protein